MDGCSYYLTPTETHEKITRVQGNQAGISNPSWYPFPFLPLHPYFIPILLRFPYQTSLFFAFGQMGST